MKPKAGTSTWSPQPVAITAALLVAAGWTVMLTTVQANPGASPPEYGWPLACQVADEYKRFGSGYTIVFHTEYLPGPLLVDALCALATVATSFAFVQRAAAAALGPRPFTLGSMMIVVAAFAAILAGGRLFPDQVETLALWPFLFSLASPLLLLGQAYARALARNRES